MWELVCRKRKWGCFSSDEAGLQAQSWEQTAPLGLKSLICKMGTSSFSSEQCCEVGPD